MTDFEISDVPVALVARIRGTAPITGLPFFFAQAFTRVMTLGVQVTGPPFGWYHSMPTDTVEVSAGFPVAAVTQPDGEVDVVQRPGGRAVLGLHVGSYDTLADTYSELQRWMTDRNLAPRGDMWEEYLTGPDTDPAAARTRIVAPLD